MIQPRRPFAARTFKRGSVPPKLLRGGGTGRGWRTLHRGPCWLPISSGKIVIDRHRSRRPAVVDVKPAEHTRDLDRLGQVDVQDGFRRHALSNPLVRSALVEVQLVLAERERRCPSSSTSTWSSNSRRTLPTKRSETAFIFGARTAVRITFAPTPWAARSNAGPNLSSRSRSNTAGASPSIVALRSCCAVHAYVAWRVAAIWTTRRDARCTRKNA